LSKQKINQKVSKHIFGHGHPAIYIYVHTYVHTYMWVVWSLAITLATRCHTFSAHYKKFKILIEI